MPAGGRGHGALPVETSSLSGEPTSLLASTTSSRGADWSRRPASAASVTRGIALRVGRRAREAFRGRRSPGRARTRRRSRVAVELGRRLTGGYDLLVSSGAQRATQTLACLLCGLGQQVDGGVLVDPGFRSAVEDRWRDAAQRARGKDLEAFREADPELVEKESALLGSVLRHLF